MELFLGTYLIVQLHFPLLLPKLLLITERVSSMPCTIWFVTWVLTDFSVWLFVQRVRQELQTEAYYFTDCLHCCWKEMPCLLKEKRREEKLVPTSHKRKCSSSLSSCWKKRDCSHSLVFTKGNSWPDIFFLIYCWLQLKLPKSWICWLIP